MTKEQIAKIKTNLTGLVPNNVLSHLELIIEHGVNTVPRLAHFLAQVDHESANFSVTRESLNYSAERLLKVFPKYFTKANADVYARKPEAIGSRVYANRMGNGDEASKEGYKFCGRGYIQLTGKENYKKLGTYLNVDLIAHPELVQSDYALESACWFFNANHILEICDKGADSDVVEAVTRKINGGVIGLDDRYKLFSKYYAALNKK